MKNVKNVALILLMAMLVPLAACGTSTNVKEDLSLKIGVMPAVDSLPIFLADQKGYFEELGLDIEVQIYTNAMNRQSALQTGELDGAMTDVIALVNNVQNGFDIKVTTSTDAAFPFLINKDFEEKEDIKVALMEVSVTNYLTDQALADSHNLEKVYINEIPARLEMVNQGKIDMAVVPEPLASQGELNGLTKKLIETDDEFSPDVFVFNTKAIEDKEKALQLFHDGYNKAVEELQRDDSEGRQLLIDVLDLNPEIKDLILLPEYNKARVPSEEFLKTIMDWNEQVLNEEVDLQYEDLVDGRFIGE